jgi:hypothetical protein
MNSEIKIIKDYPDCNIPFNTCVEASRFKREDIVNLAKHCGITNPSGTRRSICEEIYNKKGLTIPTKEKKESKCNNVTLENCNKEELRAIAKTEKYTGYYNLGKEDLIKFIKEKRGIKLSSSESESETDSETEKEAITSSKCDKETLENCNLKDLLAIAKSEGCKDFYNKPKAKLIQIIMNNRDKEEKKEKPKSLPTPKVKPVALPAPKTKPKVVVESSEEESSSEEDKYSDDFEEEEEDEEDEDEEEKSKKQIFNKIKDELNSFKNYKELSDKYPKYKELKKMLIEKLTDSNIELKDIEKIEKKELQEFILEQLEKIKSNETKIKKKLEKERRREEEERKRREEEERKRREEEERRRREEEERRRR